jgi:GT2 family glycosyltransferase
LIALWLLLAAWLCVCAIWLQLLVEQQLVVRSGQLLAPIRGAAPEPPPSVHILMPVRNAADDAAACMATALAQQDVDLTLTIVDDRSDRLCAMRLQELASIDPRVRVVRVDALPPGWLGKSHALATATPTDDRSEWLLFIDDDCRLDEPRAIRTAIENAHAENADMLTLWPRHAAIGLVEHLVVPLCGGIIAMWFGPKRSRASIRRPYANGQFILFKTEAYRRMGGHERVRLSLIEDVALAEAARESGLRLAIASGRALFCVRMYQSAWAVFDGWTRIFAGAIARPWAIAASIAWLIVGSLAPIVAAPFLVSTVLREFKNDALTPASTAATTICLMHLVLLGIVSWRFWGWGGCARRYLLLYPVSVVLVIAVLLRSLWQLSVRRSVVWRGTRYRIDRAGRILQG